MHNEAVLVVRMHEPELVIVYNGRIVGTNWPEMVPQYYKFP